MSKNDIEKLAELTAKRTATIIMKELAEMQFNEASDLVDCREAAKILGLTPGYLRSIKDNFPHVKIGSHGQGRIMFRRSQLINSYTKKK